MKKLIGHKPSFMKGIVVGIVSGAAICYSIDFLSSYSTIVPYKSELIVWSGTSNDPLGIAELITPYGTVDFVENANISRAGRSSQGYFITKERHSHSYDVGSNSSEEGSLMQKIDNGFYQIERSCRVTFHRLSEKYLK